MKDSGKTPEIVRTVVGEEGADQRVDNYLIGFCKGVPKSHIYRVLRTGEVRVNSRRVRPEYRLQIGDELRIPPIRMADPRARRAVPAGQALPVLYEDDALIALDKASGIAVHGGSGVSFGVIEQLRRQRPDARFLELAHRLDRETSGILLVAKKRSALTRLHDMLREGAVEKRYLVLVRGRWPNPLQHVRLPLLKAATESGERRVSVSEEGKPAHSIVRLLARRGDFSLLEVQIKTGRTHQIRVHLTHLGYSLAGDDKYGDFELNKQLAKQGLKRMFLHAARLELAHPLTGDALALESALPDDLAAFLAGLPQEVRRGAAL